MGRGEGEGGCALTQSNTVKRIPYTAPVTILTVIALLVLLPVRNPITIESVPPPENFVSASTAIYLCS